MNNYWTADKSHTSESKTTDQERLLTCSVTCQSTTQQTNTPVEDQFILNIKRKTVI